MKTEIEKFQSGFSGMPGVSQNHDGSTKRRLQPILLLDEPLGVHCARVQSPGGRTCRIYALYSCTVRTVYLGRSDAQTRRALAYCSGAAQGVEHRG